MDDNVIPFKSKAELAKIGGASYHKDQINIIKEGGWGTFIEMAADFTYSLTLGDFKPKGVLIASIDKDGSILVLRRCLSRTQIALLMSDYLERTKGND